MKPCCHKICTRERIINAAGELFAESGFTKTTIRDICKKAQTNVAAVNYHFSSKEHLFEETLRSVFEKQWEKFPPDLGQDKAKTPALKLKAFITAFFKRRFDKTVPPWFGRLIISETHSFRQSVHKILEKNIQKNRETLREIVREILGDKADEDTIKSCVMSVIGQTLIFMRPHKERVPQNFAAEVTSENMDHYIEHVYRFALAGIKEMKKT